MTRGQRAIDLITRWKEGGGVVDFRSFFIRWVSGGGLLRNRGPFLLEIIQMKAFEREDGNRFTWTMGEIIEKLNEFDDEIFRSCCCSRWLKWSFVAD